MALAASMTSSASLLSRNDGPAAGEGRRRALAVGNLAESLSVERGGKTFVVSIGATTQNGEKSALIANTMTDVFLQTYGEIQSDTAGRATDELTARLDELRAGVEAAERKVEDFRAEHDLVDAQGQLITDDEMVKLNEQLSIARARTIELNARAASTRSIDVERCSAARLPEEHRLDRDVRAALAICRDEAGGRPALASGSGRAIPQYLAHAGAAEPARASRSPTNCGASSSSVQAELKRAVQLEQDLAARLAQLKVRSGDVNEDLVTLRELEREAAAKRAVYEAYLLARQGDRRAARHQHRQYERDLAGLPAARADRPVARHDGAGRPAAGLASGVGLGAGAAPVRACAKPPSRGRAAGQTGAGRPLKTRHTKAPPVPPHAGPVPHPQQRIPGPRRTRQSGSESR